MTDRILGLYNKYNVLRLDGKDKPGGRHEHCHYFVLDIIHDKHAIPALRAYAASCEAEFPLLAEDLLLICRAALDGEAGCS